MQIESVNSGTTGTGHRFQTVAVNAVTAKSRKHDSPHSDRSRSDCARPPHRVPLDRDRFPKTCPAPLPIRGVRSSFEPVRILTSLPAELLRLAAAAVCKFRPTLGSNVPISFRFRLRCGDRFLQVSSSYVLRQPKIQHFGAALWRDEDVRRFQIAVDDSAVVCVGDTLAICRPKRSTSSIGKGPRLSRADNRLAFQTFHHQEIDALLPDIMQRANVRVIQHRTRSRISINMNRATGREASTRMLCDRRAVSYQPRRYRKASNHTVCGCLIRPD